MLLALIFGLSIASLVFSVGMMALLAYTTAKQYHAVRHVPKWHRNVRISDTVRTNAIPTLARTVNHRRVK
jgi:hypothetical protein